MERSNKHVVATSLWIDEIPCMYCDVVIPRSNKLQTCAECAKWLESEFGPEWFFSDWHYPTEYRQFWDDAKRQALEDKKKIVNLTPNDDEIRNSAVTNINQDAAEESVPNDWNVDFDEKYYVAYMAMKDIIIMALEQEKIRDSEKEKRTKKVTGLQRVTGYKKMKKLLQERKIKDIPSASTIKRYIKIIISQQKDTVDFKEWTKKHADSVATKAKDVELKAAA